MPAYRGRFAPSPTGPLHFGSLVAAVASFADARANGGQWLVRIEDVDGPRTMPGAADAILHTLEAYGFQWDGEVVYQSKRDAIYRAAFERLQRAGAVYPCACSRKEVRAVADIADREDGVYPGTCRNGLHGRTGRAWRIRVEGTIDFDDAVQGYRSEDLAQQTGDFVLLRTDGGWAYQLAVVVDDAAQGITRIVRGADLLSSTARQIYLQRALGLPPTSYLHVAVAVDAAGNKLSKQNGAPALDDANPGPSLQRAASFLGHALPPDLAGGGVKDIWQWLFANWRPTRIPVGEQVRID